MFPCGRKEPPPSAQPFNRFWDIAVRRTGFGKAMHSLWSLPFLPTEDHSCPFTPTQKGGHVWARMDGEGTNDDDTGVL